jgi:adenosylcobinamide-GDP ribazoletransferase
MSLRPLLVALQFLTCLPVRLDPAPSPAETGRSLLWYPLVGLLLGALLWGLDAALGAVAAPPLLRSALLLAAWVGASGALHLDGLGDSADAWVGGHSDRERTLAIMKDPYAGPMAVCAIVLVLLLKFAALATLPGLGNGLLLAPLLGRSAMPLLFASTAYVRAEGLGSPIAANLPRRGAFAVVAVVLLAVCLCWRIPGALAAAVFMLGFALIRQNLLRRLGGTTGDTAGAMLELIETAVVLILALGRGIS